MTIRVVVVDDSALVRSILCDLINRAGDMRVVGQAADLYAAREVIRELDPDVITLDIEMPRMNGLDFLKKLMMVHPMPVIMVSSFTDRGATETIKALEYGKELYANFIPGTLSWLDPNNNKAFLDGQISVTNNGISIYFTSKNSADPKIRELSADINHAVFPVGPVGVPTESHLFFNQMVMKYTKYPQAAKEFLRFMMEKEQFDPWLQGGGGYVAQPLRFYENSAIWTSDPKNMPYRDSVKNLRPGGYDGKLGYASAGAAADFIIPNMVAEAASGARTPKEAAERAQKRAERYYKT